MRFFRWILSNIIMIIIVVGCIYSYVYWGNLVGSDTPAGKAIVYLSDEFVEVKEFVDGIKEKNKDKQQRDEQPVSQEVLASTEKSEAVNTETTEVETNNATASTNFSTKSDVDESAEASSASNATAPSFTVPMSSVDTVNNGLVATASESEELKTSLKDNATVVEETNVQEINVQTASSNINNAEKKWQPVQQPVTISYSRNQTQIQQDSDGGLHELANHSVTKQKATLSAATAPKIVQVDTQEDGFVTPAIEKELETATADGGVAALTPDATRTVWINARKAFYQRDFAESEKRYKRVISMTKDNYDAYGELGNVYFHQGKNSDAADAYMAASVILINQGDLDRANSLLGLMRYLDKDKAQLLQKRLEQKK